MKYFDSPTEAISMRTRRGLRGLFVASFVALLSAGCGDYGGSQTDSSIVANSIGAGLPQGLSVTEQVTGFEQTVYPLLRQYCIGCHAAGGVGSPRIADADPAVAWSAVVDNQKVNFADPTASRLVRRLSADFHHCWSNCSSDASEVLAQILAWQTAIEVAGGTTGGVDVAELTSDIRTVSDGAEEVGEERFDAGIIARWDFKEGTGTTAFDTSNVPPAMDLSLEGPELMSSYGINVATGRAIAEADTSIKLYDRIASAESGSQAYSVEMWLANANTTQDGPARIMTYSRNSGTRNFMFGQRLYQYAARNRSFGGATNNNGNPELLTYDVDQDAQSTLQHVVVTYDLLNGRKIYVDGHWTDDVDEVAPGRLWNWDPAHRFVLGNEPSLDRQWLGQIRFAAVYDRSLSEAAVLQNYEAGIGKRVTLSFDVSQWTGGASTIEFSLTQLDDFSYLFCAPTFVSDTGAAYRIQNMRISINGVIPVSGQGFTRLNALVTSGRQVLSRQCSVIGGVVDPATDQFQLVFEQLGIFQDPVATGNPPAPGVEDFGDPVPVLGVRSYDRVNASMAVVTGVDTQTPAVDGVFDELVQQLPSTTNLKSFVSANQVGVAKLGTEYCDALVGDGTPASQTMRDAFFPDAALFGWDLAPAAAFADPAQVDIVTDPLLDQIIGAGMRGDVMGLPARDQVESILDQLIVDLSGTCGGVGEPVCDGDYTKNIVKGLCTSVVASGALHIH
jgi:Concanavalin A-like lectin/glucanases superfamily